MIFLVQWVSMVLPSSILLGMLGVRISSACLTTPRASTAWAFSREWNTWRTILLCMANLAMMWERRRWPWYLVAGSTQFLERRQGQA